MFESIIQIYSKQQNLQDMTKSDLCGHPVQNHRNSFRESIHLKNRCAFMTFAKLYIAIASINSPLTSRVSKGDLKIACRKNRSLAIS